MFALKKPICLLKDKNLETLHTDLLGRLYKEFDSQDPGGTIPNEVSKWLSDKGLGAVVEEISPKELLKALREKVPIERLGLEKMPPSPLSQMKFWLRHVDSRR